MVNLRNFKREFNALQGLEKRKMARKVADSYGLENVSLDILEQRMAEMGYGPFESMENEAEMAGGLSLLGARGKETEETKVKGFLNRPVRCSPFINFRNRT